jgi:hypothetical protein
MNGVTEDTMWDGFAGAIVQVEVDSGPIVLVPKPPSEVGVFPFDQPVHILTAYNPAGQVIDSSDNEARHEALGTALMGHRVVPTVGSAPDGTFREPGYGMLDVGLEEAIDLARTFGQRAIYRWTPDVLSIIGVDEPVQIDVGWTLQELD